MMRYLKNNFNKNKKGISPLIATILLIVVAVSIVAIVLNWSRDVTSSNLDDISDAISASEFSSGFVNFRLIRNTTFHLENLYKESITITGYMILSDKGDESHDLLNTYIDIDPVIEILPNQTAQINLACTPERNFQVNFRLSDNTYFTKNVTSTTPNINYCDSSYTSPEESESEETEFVCETGYLNHNYILCYADDFDYVRDNLNGNYILGQDIDFFNPDHWINPPLNIESTIDNWNDGNGFIPIGNYENPFTGSFDGRNNKLINLYIDRPEETRVGLFSYTNNVVLKNIILENAFVKGEEEVGSLVGQAAKNTIIKNSSSKSLTVKGEDWAIGGLVGLLYDDSSILNSFAKGTITHTDYAWSSGGLVGAAYGNWGLTDFICEIKNSYSHVNIYQDESSESTGGFVGDLYNCNLLNNYSVGSISYKENDEVGGFTGLSDDETGVVINSYWDLDISQISTSDKGEGRTTEDMMKQNTFVDWNFSGIWAIDEDETYPYLIKSQIDPLPNLSVNITSPLFNSEHSLGENINFKIDVINSQGTVTCSWSSSIDNDFGIGCDINVDDLSLGAHIITLTIEDNIDLIEINIPITIFSGYNLYAWGRNSSGQFGNDTTDGSVFPIFISSEWEQIDLSTYHTLGIKNGGELWGWGRNNKGELGDGTSGPDRGPANVRLSPIRIGDDSNWNFISAGTEYSLGIKNNGELWAWGQNNHGQLGDGSTTDRLEPVRIGNDSDWEMVSAGAIHSLAIKNGGELWAWGHNGSGKLGDGTTESRDEPVRIGNDSDWELVSAGPNNSLAIKNNGELWAWGWNQFGELGDGTTESRDEPVRIGTDSDWEIVSVGTNHSLGIKDGTLWAWGRNNNGQVGDGTGGNWDSQPILEPTQIDEDTNWEYVSAGISHSLAINSGELWAWGRNDFGRLGDGTTEDKIEPVKIGSNSDWIIISAGGSESLGLRKN